MKLVNVEEMRRIEQAADASGHSYETMMTLAGRAVAQSALGLQLIAPEQRALVLVGPGNNGGDGLVAALALLDSGVEVSLYIWKRDIKGDRNYRALKQRRRGIAILWADNDPDFAKLRDELQHCDLIIDALLGTGATRPITGRLAELLAVVKEQIATYRKPPAAPPAPFGLPRFPIIEALAWGNSASSVPTMTDDYLPDDFADDEDEDWDEEDREATPRWDMTDEGEADDEDLLDEDWPEDQPHLPWPPLPVLAVDCPSGLNCDTGALDPATLHASVTVTFAYPKWGHLQFPGVSACGVLTVADIGVPVDLAADIQVELAEPTEVSSWLPYRPLDAHKGTFGKAMLAAGSLNYTGAALLSAAAAMRAGAGLVTLAIPSALQLALAGALPEVTWLPLPGSATHTAAGAAGLVAALAGYDALLVGPGLTTTEDARGFVEALFGPQGLPPASWQGRTVVDADALNLLADLPDWPGRLPPNSILTPHPGEMARLTGLSVAEVNGNRIAAARRYAAAWGHVVLLKGPHTVIAAPDGRASVLPFAVPQLATAGSGDVLAGVIVSLLAQGVPTFEAAVVGAYLHGFAGAQLLRAGVVIAVARDILERLPEALRQLYLG